MSSIPSDNTWVADAVFKIYQQQDLPLLMGANDSGDLCRTNYCFSCEKEEEEEASKADESNSCDKEVSNRKGSLRGTLLRCAQCMCACYCSRECQKKDWGEHKADCRKIKKSLSILKSEAMQAEKRQLESMLKQGTLSYKTQTHDVAGNYLAAQFDIANIITGLAYKMETVELWNRALEEALELLRFDPYDSFRARFIVPYFLLYLNRNEDVVNFCSYMMGWSEGLHINSAYYTRDPNLLQGEDRWMLPEEDHVNQEFMALYRDTSPGQWIYPDVVIGSLVHFWDCFGKKIDDLFFSSQMYVDSTQSFPMWIAQLRTLSACIERVYACKLLHLDPSSNVLFQQNLKPVLPLIEAFILPSEYSRRQDARALIMRLQCQSLRMMGQLALMHGEFLFKALAEPSKVEILVSGKLSDAEIRSRTGLSSLNGLPLDSSQLHYQLQLIDGMVDRGRRFLLSMPIGGSLLHAHYMRNRK